MPAKEVTPVLEETKYKGVKHVNVERTVKEVSEVLEKEGMVELLAREGEINRVGMVIRQVQEASQGTIAAMRTEYRTEKKEDREVNVTYFRVILNKK